MEREDCQVHTANDRQYIFEEGENSVKLYQIFDPFSNPEIIGNVTKVLFHEPHDLPDWIYIQIQFDNSQWEDDYLCDIDDSNKLKNWILTSSNPNIQNMLDMTSEPLKVDETSEPLVTQNPYLIDT